MFNGNAASAASTSTGVAGLNKDTSSVPSYTPYLGRAFEMATSTPNRPTIGSSGANNRTFASSYIPSTASIGGRFEMATSTPHYPTTTGSSGPNNTSSVPHPFPNPNYRPAASWCGWNWASLAKSKNTPSATSTTRTTAVCKETSIKKNTPSSDPWEDYFNKRRNSKRTTNPAALEKERKRKNEKEVPSLLRGMEGGSQRASSMHRLMEIGTAELYQKFKVKEAAEKVAKEWGEEKWYVRETANKLLDAIWKAEGRQGVREQEEPARTTRKRRAVEEPQRPTPAKRRPKMEIITID